VLFLQKEMHPFLSEKTSEMLNFKKASKHAQNAEMHPLFLSEKTSEMRNFKKAAKNY